MSRPPKTSYDFGAVHIEINDAGEVSACKAVDGGLIEGPYFPAAALAKAAAKICAILKAKDKRNRITKRKQKRNTTKRKALESSGIPRNALLTQTEMFPAATNVPQIGPDELPAGKEGFEG